MKTGLAVMFAYLMLLTCVPSAFANYGEKADGVLSYIDKILYDSGMGTYRVNSGSQGEAGLREISLQLSALSTAARYNPGKYTLRATRVCDYLKRYWDEKGMDASYDDSAITALALLDACEVLKDKGSLATAGKAFDRAISGWDASEGGVISSPQSAAVKNAVGNGAAAVAALRLAGMTTAKPDYLAWAEKIVSWMNEKLRDEDGLYFSGTRTGVVDRTKLTRDTALMIKAHLLLYERTKVRKHFDEARKMAIPCEEEFLRPGTGAFQDRGDLSYLLCEAFVDLSKAVSEKHYLQIAQQNAVFIHRWVLDKTDGGYWSDWDVRTSRTEAKTLAANAAVARLYGVLSSFPDTEELYAAGIRAASTGDYKSAVERFGDAAIVDDTFVEAHYRLFRCRVKLKDDPGSSASLERLVELYQTGGQLRDRLKAVAAPDVLKLIERDAGQ